MENRPSFSIIIPLYNEEKSVKQAIENLKNYLTSKNYIYEIIMVNDASTDKSEEVAKTIQGVKLITHPYNKGYGAAIKTGVRKSQYDWVLFFDSDGQHKPEDIEKFLAYTNNFDMIVGDRVNYRGSIIRKLGKKFLSSLANYLTQQKIPDLNSGMRLVKKEHFLRFVHLFPNSFSLTTTITLSFFREGLNIKYVPVTVELRKGKSSLKVKDGFKTILGILRTVVFFSPLRVFLPISFLFFIGTLISLGFNLRQMNLSDTTILLFVSSLLFFFFGLIADQLAAIRRGIK